MDENKNRLKKALEAIKNEQIPPGPPQEVVDSTIAKLAEAAGQPDIVRPDNRLRIIERLRAAKSLTSRTKRSSRP